jgi:phage replication-related protein YjqB (UPF0714/DUF867 family)
VSPAAATRVTWAQLLAHPDVREEVVVAGPVGVMAFHGGLEMGTAEVARQVASASGASLYIVDQPAELRWHVPSHDVDPAGSDVLGNWMDGVEVVAALHGYGRIDRPRRILLGGRNRTEAMRLASVLETAVPELAVVTDLDEIPAELRGLHPRNPVNRPPAAGVQVELPPSARDPRLNVDGPDRVARALVEWVAGYRAATTLP